VSPTGDRPQDRLTRVVTVVALTVVPALILNVWAQALFERGGPARTAALIGLVPLAIVLVVGTVILWRTGGLWGASSRLGAPPAELATVAGQAEHWLVALGSDAEGMAATEWFRAQEPELRALLDRYLAEPAAVEYLASICDALDAWYVRERHGADLLEVAEMLARLADRAGRRDLKELAAIRRATAHRMCGAVEEASRELGRSAELATRGRVATALRTRRRVEWALGNLTRADGCPPGRDAEEHLATAADRLADAAATLPRADVAGDTAIRLNQGAVALYRGDAEVARSRLALVEARAQQAKDVSSLAHAQELLGVAAWMLDHWHEAVARWKTAIRLYADIEEREGQARCLQHLGSAALVNSNVARLLGREGDQDGVALLWRSAELRGGSHGHPVLEYYLRVAGAQTGAPPESGGAAPQPAAGWLRIWWRGRGGRGGLGGRGGRRRGEF
jgi:tetratricopeptide (TPR) repeat protein